MDLPHLVPQRVLQIQAAHAPQNAGIGDVGVHLSIVLPGGGHQGLHVCLAAHIAAHGQALDVVRHRLRALEVEIGHHHATRAVRRKALRDAAANAAGATGHDGDFVSNVHAKLLSWVASVWPDAAAVCHRGDTSGAQLRIITGIRGALQFTSP
jgi:hypothetical protein